MDQPQNPNHPDPVRPAGDAAPPLTPAAWLMSNGPWLLVFAAVVGLVWYKLGLDSVWAIAKVVVGLGFVIFIHELGHFLAAKWCDVHVQTFSIGFGPALPGCSFQRGETTYKIGAIPLGGYVNMIGEGPEADEDEDYPRSFKNKTVGQRMIIISAGVVMNVLLGAFLFIVVYYYHGVEQAPAIVGGVDPGSPMWKQGIPTGSLITRIDGIRNPVFQNLKRKVILSGAGEKIPFTFQMYGPDGEKAGERSVELEPRLDANDLNPVVGVALPEQLRLIPKPEKDVGRLPVARRSAAAAARPVPLKPGEVIVATTDPEHPDRIKPLARKDGGTDFQEFAKRLRALEGQRLVIHVLPKAAKDTDEPESRDVPQEGFQFNDTIIGCTEPPTGGGPYDPFRVGELPRDPRHETGDRRDPFAFHTRLRRLAGLPMVVRVRRGDPNSTDPRQESSTGEVVNLFVPPAYHVTFGMRMKMGKVAGVRENSPLARAFVEKNGEKIQLQRGDELTKVVMTDERGKELYSCEDLDPERLPYLLRQAADKAPGKKHVVLTFRREPSAPDHTLPPVEWDRSWDDDEEVPLSAAAPLAIPQLGLAYWVLSQVVEVQKGSPAAEAGLKKDDTIKEVRFWTLSPYSGQSDWNSWTKLESERNGGPVDDRWAQAFSFVQQNDSAKIQVQVARVPEMKEPIELTGREDPEWPLASRGILLLSDYELQKAGNFGEALVMGGRESVEMIGLMYLQLRSLLTGRVSPKHMGGPIAMMTQGFSVARLSNFGLLLFLGAISINLAVVNFLPIPILDGGHMVFLIYEKLRGRPPAENVRIVATYIGLAMIALLMIFVFYQDFQNYVRRMIGI